MSNYRKPSILKRLSSYLLTLIVTPIIFVLIMFSLMPILALFLSLYLAKKMFLFKNSEDESIKKIFLSYSENSNSKYELKLISKLLAKILPLHENNKSKELIHNILRGDNTDIGRFLPKTTIYYSVLIVSIDGYSEMKRTNSFKSSKFFKDKLLLEIESTYSKAAITNGIVHDGGRLCCILGFTESNIETNKQLIEDLSIELLDRVKNQHKISISIGIGMFYKSINHINTSYHEAIESLNYRMVTGYGKLHFYSKICNKNKMHYIEISDIKTLFTLVKDSNLEDSLLKLNEIITNIGSIQELTYESIMQNFYRILNATLEYLNECNIKISDIVDSSTNIYKALASKETIEQASDFLETLLTNIINYQRIELSDTKTSLNNILNTLKENIRNKNFDVNILVEQTGLSYTSIRTTLKEELNCTYLQYVHSVRIQISKEILLSTKLTLKDVASEVGYYNEQSFTRQFKKLENMTPGEYRKVHNAS